MSQYGCIPQSRVVELTINFSIANPSSWQFEKDGVMYGGIEEVVLTTEQRAEIERLDGLWFSDRNEFTSWLDSHADPLLEVIADRQFGQQLLNQFLAENKTMNLTTNQSLGLLAKLGTVKALLEAGALTAAKEVLNSVETDAIFTAERKANFLAKLTDYLA